MVLSTGNKSEMSAGYATLYGDMCGGYAVLKDVYKTTVFALSRWRNERPAHRRGWGPSGHVMPERVITKPPSAELKPNQTDQDTLPPYDELDDILECLVEHEMPVDQIVARGHARRLCAGLAHARSRRIQAAPGAARRQDHMARLRPRSPLSDHQRLPQLARCFLHAELSCPSTAHP